MKNGEALGPHKQETKVENSRCFFDVNHYKMKGSYRLKDLV